MYKEFKNKLKEALLSTLPIIIIIVLLHITNLVSIGSKSDIILFVISSIFLIIGIGLFSLGSDISMMPMGEHIGKEIIKTKKLWLSLLIVFVLGTLITIAEPDLSVLATQVPIDSMTLIIIVAAGVGLFLTLALLRILFKIDLRFLLIGGYALIFILAIFANKSFLPLAFDSGGVTTGPITVPFLMSLGVGISSIRKSDDQADSFGMVALCSIGPILSVMLMSLFIKETPTYEATTIISHGSILKDITHAFFESLKEVGLALLPIFVFFYIFQYFTHRLNKKRLLKIFIGILYTYLGLTLFLTAVNIGFMPIGSKIGETLAIGNTKWL